MPGAEIVNPRIESNSILFIADGVALAAGTWTYRDGANSVTTPLLFLMKRDGAVWKIAAVRALATAPK
jgi:hypothetical protein